MIVFVTSFSSMPGMYNDNDIVFRTAQVYREQQGEDVKVVRMYVLNKTSIRAIIRYGAGWLNSQHRYYNDVETMWLPYITIRRSLALHMISSAVFGLMYWRKIAKYIRGARIIHTNYLFPDGVVGYMLSKYLRIKHVITLRNERKYVSGGISGKISQSILRSASKVAVLGSEGLEICNSAGVTCVKIRHYVDDVFFNECLYHRSDDILYVGKMISRKNVDYLVRSFRILTEINIGYSGKLLLVGDGEERKNLESLTAELSLSERVIFKGRLPSAKIADLMKRSSVYVMLSQSETYGISYAEAFVSGMKVVAPSDSGFASDEAVRCNVFIVDKDKIKNIHYVAQIIWDVLDSESIDASRSVKMLFRKHEVVSTYKQLYE